MFTLDQVVPWGRSFDEDPLMFAMSDRDLALTTIGCADGPASFNAEATRRGGKVTSCDPLYRFDSTAIRARIGSTYGEVLEQTRRNAHEFVWDSIGSVEELGATRMAAMDDFLGDYANGRAEGRYLEAELPTLPFADGAFDLALCSHFLFLYSVQFDETFHRAAVLEMCRVAAETRIFPLLALGATPSVHVEPVSQHLSGIGFDVTIETVPYEFQRGGNQMMRIRRR